MDLMEAIYKRRAVRSYTDRPVEKAAISALLDGAVQAPSAVNDQPWAFAVVQDKDLLNRYSERGKALWLHGRQAEALPPELRAMLAEPAFNVFYNASTLIVICAKPGGERQARDCCLAAQNLMLAAHGMGLATCPIGLALPLLETPEVRRELNIPDGFVPVFPVIVGYAAAPAPPVERRHPEILSWR